MVHKSARRLISRHVEASRKHHVISTLKGFPTLTQTPGELRGDIISNKS